MNKIKSATTRVKNFVVRHKVAFAVTATAAAGLWLNRSALSDHDKFLEEKGLLEEFYSPKED